MATITINHSGIVSKGSGDTTWRDRTYDYMGTYAACRFTYQTSDFDVLGSISQIDFILNFGEDTNKSFKTNLYVGGDVAGYATNIPGATTLIGTFPATIGSATENDQTLTFSLTERSAIDNFLSLMKAGNYIYIHGAVDQSSSGTCSIWYKSFTIILSYVEGNIRHAIPYIWTSATRTQYTYPEQAMTSNSSQGCVASASSTYSSSYPIWRAFDKSTTTAAWATTRDATARWIQLIMPKALYDISVTITNRGDNQYICAPISGKIYGSNDDGATLTEIGSYSGRDGATAQASSTVVCTNSNVAYNTVRIDVETWEGDSLTAIGEISISGYDYAEGQYIWKPVTPYIYGENGWEPDYDVLIVYNEE